MKYLRTLAAIAICLLVTLFVHLALTQQFITFAYVIVAVLLTTIMVYTILAMSREDAYGISFDAINEQFAAVLAQRDERDREITNLRMQLLNVMIDPSNQPTDPWVRAALAPETDARDEGVAQEV